MFCKYCGNQFGEKDLFCAKCGAKKDENIQMKSTSPSSNGIENTNSHKKNIFLSNKMVLLLFIISYILVFFVEVQAIAETNFPSGFILLFVPFIAAFKGVPQFVGIILSINNLKKKNNKMLSAIFVFGLISLFVTLGTIMELRKSLWVWLSLLSSISLNIVILLKLILKRNDS